MLPKNLCFFRFPTTTDFSEVERILPHVLMKPVGPLDLSSRGFMSPFGQTEKETFAHRRSGFLWLAVSVAEKILPGGVVSDHVATKVAEIERNEGRSPGGKERKRIKDDVLHELLPRALVKTSRHDAFIDLDHGYIAVLTASRKSAENFVSDVRGLLGGFPAVPVNAGVAPRTILTSWISGDEMPEGLTLGEKCELKDPAEGGASVRCQAQELRSDEIEQHLEVGKQVTKLELTYADNLRFVLGDDLTVRGIKFLDGALEQLDISADDGVRAELDAMFCVASAEVRSLFLLLEQAMEIASAD